MRSRATTTSPVAPAFHRGGGRHGHGDAGIRRTLEEYFGLEAAPSYFWNLGRMGAMAGPVIRDTCPAKIITGHAVVYKVAPALVPMLTGFKNFIMKATSLTLPSLWSWVSPSARW